MDPTSLLWHYTFGQNFQRILADAALKPSAAYLSREGCPVVWFSRNRVWEPAALRGLITDDGTVQNLTMEELGTHGGGLFRIGVARETVPHNFDDFVKKSELPRDRVAELRRVAKDKGANLKEWFASFEPVPREQWLAVEMWQNHAWVALTPSLPANFVVSGS